jgi:sugar O-acyltransferase (sialic acid O-acetyltransferase NeuD family)
MNIVIIGAGGHGQVVADIFRAAARAGAIDRVAGYLDDARAVNGKPLAGARVLGRVSQLRAIPHDGIIIAIGDNRTRERLWDAAGPHETFVVARHPSAITSEDVRIGDGSMLCAGVIVNTGTIVGRGVILNTGCTVDHHSSIGDFVHIAPGVHMGGEVTVGARSFVGIGAVVLPGITIGEGSVIGAGAVVTRDVAPYVTVVGCPARPVRSTRWPLPTSLTAGSLEEERTT